MKKYCIIMLFGCLLLACGAKAAVYDTSEDVLDGAGGFEDDGGMGIWTAWSGNGSRTVGADSTYSNTGTYSMYLGQSTASGQNTRVITTLTNLVVNRTYRVDSFVRMAANSAPSYARVRLGSASWSSSMNVTWGNSYFKANTLYFSIASTTAELALVYYSNSAYDNIWFDDVAVYQEIALPNVDAYAGNGTMWTLTNTGGRTDDDAQLIAFDPDVEISYLSGFDVGGITATWTSDNQLDLVFANSLVGSVTLQVTNPNGNASYMVTIPEPATICILGLGLLGLARHKK